MFLTTKGRYAIMAIIRMHTESKERQNVSIKSIALKENLSIHYLEQLFALMKKADIVDAIKGPGGGYIFKKSPAEITLSNILKAVGENIEVTKCGIKNTAFCNIKADKKCNSHEIWKNLSSYILVYLNSTTIEDVTNKNFFFK